MIQTVSQVYLIKPWTERKIPGHGYRCDSYPVFLRTTTSIYLQRDGVGVPRSECMGSEREICCGPDGKHHVRALR